MRYPMVVVLAAAATASAEPPAAMAQAAASAASGAAVTRFSVRIENVTTPSTLKLSSGGARAIAFSPAAWAIHAGSSPLFAPGEADRGQGLKGLAEAGMAGPFAARLRSVAGVTGAGAASTPVASGPEPGGKMSQMSSPMKASSPMLEPGFRYEFTVEARRGDRLSFALMIGESNDGLVATGPDGIALFDASGKPVAGNMTAQLQLWDAGTEVNEDPGLGPNQGMRQGAPHAGDPERRPVRLMSEAEFGDRWPPAARMVRVTITPMRG